MERHSSHPERVWVSCRVFYETAERTYRTRAIEDRSVSELHALVQTAQQQLTAATRL